MEITAILENKEPVKPLQDTEHLNWLALPHTQHVLSILKSHRQKYLEMAASKPYEVEAIRNLEMANAISKVEQLIIKKSI